LVGDKASELRIHSGIYAGVLGHNASQRFAQEVRVQAWGKPFTVTSRVYQRPDLERDGTTYKEVFTVTLYETEDPKEMRAEFEHIVYRNEKIYLRFAGITIVDNRWKGA